MSMSITSWVDGRIKVAVDELYKDMKDTLVAEIHQLEQRLTEKLLAGFGAIPGQVLGGISQAGLDAEHLVSAMSQDLQNVLPSFLDPIPRESADLINNLIGAALDPARIAQEIVGHLPHLFGENYTVASPPFTWPPAPPPGGTAGSGSFSPTAGPAKEVPDDHAQ